MLGFFIKLTILAAILLAAAMFAGKPAQSEPSCERDTATVSQAVLIRICHP